MNGIIDTVIDDSQVSPVYLIKGKYYSEQLYTGPIITSHKIAFNNKQQNTKGTLDIVHSYEIDAGTDIKELSTNNETIFNTYFLKTKHFAENMMNLSIPKDVDVKITQNKDVEKYLNSNKMINSLASIGTYGVIRPNDPAYDSIQQRININSTVNIPDNGTLYVFLTSSNQRYPIVSSESVLNVEYIG